MAATCFFCQNLLSDFLEGILPAARHEEIRAHLDTCRDCRQVRLRLDRSLKLIRGLGPAPFLSETGEKSIEAAFSAIESGLTRSRVSKAAPWVLTAVLLLTSVAVYFPSFFPWLSYLHEAEDDSHFVRYFPLLQGATEIIDEQASWLTIKDPLAASLWEEGGMTPEEFEKTFPLKGAKGE